MSRSSKTALSIVAVFFGLIGFLQIDDELSPQAQALLEPIDWKTSSQAYLFLLGMGAPRGIDPLTEGKAVLAEIRLSEETYSEQRNTEGSFSDMPLYESRRAMIELTDSPLFCSAREPTCLTSLLRLTEAEPESSDHAAIRARYLKFLSMRGYRTLTIPHFLEPFPPYSYLSRGNRLSSLAAISKARTGEFRAAADELSQLIVLQQEHIGETDNLIGRMMAYSLLNETIDVLFLLAQQYPIDVIRIRPMSIEELSLSIPMKREFTMIVSGLDSVATNDALGPWWPNWMIKTVYKPIMTINASVPSYVRAIDLSELGVKEFAEAVSASQPDETQSAWFRNPVGTVLSSVGGVNLDAYAALGFDLNTKITLFNALQSGDLSESDLSALSNPFYKEHRPPEIDTENQRVCFDGPLDDARFYRCLALLPKY